MDEPLPEVPPPPLYSDAKFQWTDEGFRIDLKAKDPHGLRWLFGIVGMLSGLPGLVLLSWSMEALIDDGSTAVWPVLVVGSLLTIVGLMCLTMLLVSVVMRTSLIFDGKTLSIGMSADEGQRIPIEDLIGLRVHRKAKPALDIHFNAPRGERVRRRVPCDLEAVTPDGTLKVMNLWAEKDIRWVAATVHAILGLEPLMDRDDAIEVDAPKAVSIGNVLTTRYRLQIGICCALLLVPLLWWVISDVTRTINAQSWPSVTGRLVEVAWTQNGDDYDFDLKYAYEVNERSYTSERFSAGSPGAPDMQRFATNHRPGFAVTVYYNPADPSQAVLQRDIVVLDWLVQGALVLFLLAPLVWVIHGGKRSHRELARKYAASSKPAKT